jgi:hypothetical protein
MPWSARGRVEDEPRGVRTNALNNALRNYKRKSRESASGEGKRTSTIGSQGSDGSIDRIEDID